MIEEEKINEELLYDLRQTFVILITEIKKEILISRSQRDYPRWKDLLDSLYIEISKNFTNEEITEFEELNKQISGILNKYSPTYMKRSSNNANEVYNALRTLDIWINRKMNEKNMYGLKEIDDTAGL